MPVNTGEVFMKIILFIVLNPLPFQSNSDTDYVLNIMDRGRCIPHDQLKDLENRDNKNVHHLKIDVIHANSNDDFYTAAKEQSLDLTILTHLQKWYYTIVEDSTCLP